jgi:hypothetical protein
VVTHLTTNPPVHCLSTAERTGSSIFSVLWSYVEEVVAGLNYDDVNHRWQKSTLIQQGVDESKRT